MTFARIDANCVSHPSVASSKKRFNKHGHNHPLTCGARCTKYSKHARNGNVVRMPMVRTGALTTPQEGVMILPNRI